MLDSHTWQNQAQSLIIDIKAQTLLMAIWIEII
jgi:hypothetical protein